MESYSVEAYLKATGADKFAGAFKSAGAQVEGFKGKVNKSTGIIKGFLKTAGILYLAKKGFDMVRDSVAGATKRIDTFEQFKRVMTAVTGSSKDAGRALKLTDDIVTGTAYTLDGAARSVQNFVTRGASIDDATKYVQAFGDAVAFYGDGSQEQFDNVSDALAKMLTKGKVSMDQLDRLFDAGIDAVGIYAKATGRSAESVQKDLSSGKISAKKFIDTVSTAMMEGTNGVTKIAGAAKKNGATWGSTMANMKTAVARGVANIITSIDKMLTDNGLPDMRTMIADFGKKFESVLSSIATGIPKAVSTIKNIVDAIKPWVPLIEAAAAGVIGFLAATKGVAAVVGIINGIKSAFMTARIAVMLFNGALLANPIGLIVAAIAAAAILVIKYWEPIKAFFIKMWGVIKEAGLAVWEVLKPYWTATVEFFKSIWQSVSSFFSSIWNGFKTTATSIWEGISAVWQFYVNFYKTLWQGVVTFFTTIWDGIKTVALAIWDVLSTAWTNAVTNITAIFGPIVGFFSQLWTTIVNTATAVWYNLSLMLSGIWSSIKTAAQAAWTLIKTVMLAPILLFIDLVTGNFQAFKSDLSQIWNNIKSAATTIWNALKSAVVAVVKGLTSSVSVIWTAFKSTLVSATQALKSSVIAMWNVLKTGVTNVVKVLKSVVISTWNAIKSAVISVVHALRSGIVSVWNAIKSAISSAMSGIRSVITSIWNGIKSTALSIVNGMKTTMIGVWNGLKSTTSSIFNGIKSVITSPLKAINLLSIGKNIIQGLINGIKSKIAAVGKAISSVTSKITGKIRGILGIHSPSKVLQKIGEYTGEGLVLGIKSTIRSISKMSERMAQAVIPNAQPLDIAGQVARTNRSVQKDVTHSVNMSNGRIETLLQKIADSNQVIVLDTGELVGGTRREYDRANGNALELTERWGR